MALVNIHFLNLQQNYLFADIAKKVNAFKVMHPGADVISLGIGDVTQPLCPAVTEAMHKAVDEMATAEGFRGYGPEQGYDFLREAILKNDFLPRGIHLDIDEVFINDGAKSDTGNFQELLHWDNFIGVTDPIYPVYIDSNVMIGRCGVYKDGRWTNVRYMPTKAENGFVPELPKGRPVDVIYLCYPNNPTGTVITKQELRKWVNYALKNDALILYDAAYQAYIQDPKIPHSIYEIRGARKCAVEFRSYSKTAGFTGVRCGYTIVPKEVTVSTFEGERISLNQLWLRRQCTKFNGCSYISPSVPPRPSIRPRARLRSRPPSTTTCRTPSRCSLPCVLSATSATEARMPHTFGCAPPTAWVRGNSSRLCSTVPTSSALQASASVPPARATSASPPSAVTKRPKKHYNASRLGANNSKPLFYPSFAFIYNKNQETEIVVSVVLQM